MSVFRFSTASAQTSPPRPPFPPFGPPNSMNFSRRKETQPFPPAPLARCTFAMSRNFMPEAYQPNMRPVRRHSKRGEIAEPSSVLRASGLGAGPGSSRREHRYVGPAFETLAELYLAIAEGKQRVVLSHADVLAGE